MDTLHVLNGECLRDYLKEQLKNETVICFNECIADGEVTEEVFSPRFFEIRSEEINKYYGASKETYKQKTENQIEVLKSKDYNQIILWFDEDMFCQMNLLTLLTYMEQRDYKGKITIHLVKDKYWEVVNKDEIILETRQIQVGEYFTKVYQKVLVQKEQIDRSETYYKEATKQLPSLEQGIKLYEQYLMPTNELTKFIDERSDWPDKRLVGELLECFREYGLGDIQYFNLIKKCRVRWM